MDCLLAQQTLSEAADREPMDSELLAAARTHCSTCPDCSRFVRAQIAVANIDLPEPPADLADRVMAAVRAEAAAQVAAETPLPEQTGQTAERSPADFAADSGELAPIRPAAWQRRRVPALTVIAAFAAVVFAAAFGMAVVGSRYLSTSPSDSTRELATGQSGAPSESKALPQAAPPAADNSTATAPQTPSTTSAAPPDFITVTGGVYRSEGEAAVEASTLHDLGLITTSLTASGTASQVQVRAGTDPDVVYLAGPSGNTLAFKRVKREFNGQSYYLVSADLTSIATWPTLPAKVALPTAPDGSPTFVSAGADSNGVSVYRLASSPNSGGIGIAPGSPSSDPAAGNPNWTYWETAQ